MTSHSCGLHNKFSLQGQSSFLGCVFFFIVRFNTRLIQIALFTKQPLRFLYFSCCLYCSLFRSHRQKCVGSRYVASSWPWFSIVFLLVAVGNVGIAWWVLFDAPLLILGLLSYFAMFLVQKVLWLSHPKGRVETSLAVPIWLISVLFQMVLIFLTVLFKWQRME